MHLVYPHCICKLFLVCPALFVLGHQAPQVPRKTLDPLNNMK